MTTDVDSTLEHEIPSAPAPLKVGGGFASALFFLTGFASAAAGIAMIHAKSYSWTLFRVARDVEGYGISKGELITGGLVLMGLGIALRHMRMGAKSMATHVADALSQPSGGDSLSMQRLEGAVTQLQRGLERVDRKLAALVSMQQETQSAKSAGNDESEGARNHQSDALFRLAASVDKLGFKLDESFAKHVQPLGEQISSLSSDLGEHLAQALDRMAGDTLERSVEGGMEDYGDDEELSVLVTLEEDDAEFDDGSELGLLDKLDDFGNFGAEPQRPTPAVDFDAGAGDGPILEFDVSASGPAIDFDSMDETPAPLPKKEPRNLDALLPDDNVDRALRGEQKRRQR
jgi:hypothetical protein